VSSEKKGLANVLGKLLKEIATCITVVNAECHRTMARPAREWYERERCSFYRSKFSGVADLESNYVEILAVSGSLRKALRFANREMVEMSSFRAKLLDWSLQVGDRVTSDRVVCRIADQPRDSWERRLLVDYYLTNNYRKVEELVKGESDLHRKIKLVERLAVHSQWSEHTELVLGLKAQFRERLEECPEYNDLHNLLKEDSQVDVEWALALAKRMRSQANEEFRGLSCSSLRAANGARIPCPKG
jgi:hypothetical protein